MEQLISVPLWLCCLIGIQIIVSSYFTGYCHSDNGRLRSVSDYLAIIASMLLGLELIIAVFIYNKLIYPVWDWFRRQTQIKTWFRIWFTKYYTKLDHSDADRMRIGLTLAKWKLLREVVAGKKMTFLDRNWLFIIRAILKQLKNKQMAVMPKSPAEGL